MPRNTDPPVRAIVRRVIEGHRGYVVTYLDKGNFVAGMESSESVTFALKDWRGDDPPRYDQVVLLRGVQLFKHGWRAASASPISLEQGRQGG